MSLRATQERSNLTIRDDSCYFSGKNTSVVATALSLLILFLGCAGPPPRSDPEVDFSRLDEIDQILFREGEDFLPPPAAWSPCRISTPSPEGVVKVWQDLPLSSLAYLPRLIPRWEKSFSEAGAVIEEIKQTPEGEKNLCSITLAVNERVTYYYSLSQTISGKIGLVIDDLGYTVRDKDLLLSLNYPLTVAILPGLYYSNVWDEMASAAGFDVLLHCPLEALNSNLDPGPGKILCDTHPEEVRRILREDLECLPHAIGVNNHMGSAFTRDTSGMTALLKEVKARGLFFLDSLTISHTVTSPLAEELGVDFARRDIFLDNEKTEDFFLRQWGRLKRKTLKRSSAVAIGHYRRLTLEMLEKEIPGLAEDNLQLVPLADLVEEQGRAEKTISNIQ